MSKDGYAVLINVACCTGWLMVMLPAILFLRRAWSVRRDTLFDLMTDDVLDLYYKQFYPSRRIGANMRVTTFKKDFCRKYGGGGTSSPSLCWAFYRLGDCTVPVSYTHLDVYKRQVRQFSMARIRRN